MLHLLNYLKHFFELLKHLCIHFVDRVYALELLEYKVLIIVSCNSIALPK